MSSGFRLGPAVVSGVVVSGSARVVSDGVLLVVVWGQGKRFFRVVSSEVGVSAGKRVLVVVDEGGVEGSLVVVPSGGCSCGKPWLKKPSDSSLLAEAAVRFGVGVDG